MCALSASRFIHIVIVRVLSSLTYQDFHIGVLNCAKFLIKAGRTTKELKEKLRIRIFGSI